MPKTDYDHHKKAGNQGDVIKHVALIAALDKVLDEHQQSTFHYADTFAGYVQNSLVKGNEWPQGIGKFFQRRELDDNKHTKLYKRWYLSRPQLLGGMYPGSSLIAADVCAWKKRKVRLSLWDTCSDVVEDLRKTFKEQQHYISKEEATPEEVMSANFLLIDPPKNCWNEIRKFLENYKHPVLVWLPVGVHTTQPPTEAGNSSRAREKALEDGFGVTKVQWANSGRGAMGCQLLYRLPDEARSALRKAVDHVATILGWKCHHYDHD